MERYEVIIVGAGPAGSTAAYFLARQGVKVALVDKQIFPRDKTCGDGVTSPGLARLERLGLGGWLAENSFNAPGELLFSAPNGQAVRIRPDNPDFCYGRVIPRLQLDEALAHRAVAAGAELLEGVQLNETIRPAAGGIQLSGAVKKTNRYLRLESKLLIAADGAHASLARSLGLVKEPPDLVALRAYFEDVGGGDSLLEIHYDRNIMPGYGWIFPLTGGRANVGLGTYVSRSRQRDVDLKGALQTFIHQNPYASARLGSARLAGPLKGFPLRSRMAGVIPVADHVLLAGEAAGLVNPLNGEGIGTAMISGELAAGQAQAALIAGDFSGAALSPYARALEQQIGRLHRAAGLVRRLLSFPGILNRTIGRAQRDPKFAQTLFDVIVEAKPVTAALEPAFLLRLLAG